MIEKPASNCIAGTRKPRRRRQNAERLEAGAPDEATLKSIRARWKEAAKPEWTGQN